LRGQLRHCAASRTEDFFTAPFHGENTTSYCHFSIGAYFIYEDLDLNVNMEKLWNIQKYSRRWAIQKSQDRGYDLRGELCACMILESSK
jgi:hypothetical protein